LRVVGLVALLLVGNVAFHIEAHARGTAETSARIGIATIVLLIALIGGRIIPSFTRNWLVRENPGRLPVPFSSFDGLVISVSVLALVLWVALPTGGISGDVLLAGAALNIVRLLRWAGDRTVRDRLVLILHVGYLFVPLGFLLAGLAAFDVIVASAALHAWMAGAAGIMTLAVMTRASLGHTGQPLTASPATQVIYAAIVVAALARIDASVQPILSNRLLALAAIAWCVAFFGFAATYGPLLLRPRRK